MSYRCYCGLFISHDDLIYQQNAEEEHRSEEHYEDENEGEECEECSRYCYIHFGDPVYNFWHDEMSEDPDAYTEDERKAFGVD